MGKTITETLAEHKAAAQGIVDKAEKEGRDLTDAELKAFDEQIAEFTKVKKRAEQGAALAARLEGMSPDSLDLGAADDAPFAVKAGSLGERFTQGAGYQGLQKMAREMGGLGRNANINIQPTRVGSMKDLFAYRKDGTAPSAGDGDAPASVGALTTTLAHLQNLRFPTQDVVERPVISLLDLISRGTTAGAFEYLQIVAVDRRTAIIPENTGDDETDTLKPQSTFTTALADAKVFDYADGYTVTNQMLQDAPALASFLNTEFRYSFDTILADMLLNGTGLNGQPKGLLHTSGVQGADYTAGTDATWEMIKAVRQAVTKLRQVGNLSILISPEDAEAIDLWRDNEGRFLGGGPFGRDNPTLWRRPLVVSDQLDRGMTIVGDFRQMALLDRSGLSVQAFNQHKDYAARNLTYVRAELRAAQTIWRPAHFVVIEKTAGAGGSGTGNGDG